MDYSKWDRMAADMSDSDDGGPRVTTLKKPSTVTIGRNGYTIGQSEVNPKSIASTSGSKIKQSKWNKHVPQQSKKSSKKSLNIDYSKWDRLADEMSDSDQSTEPLQVNTFKNQLNDSRKETTSNIEQTHSLSSPQKIGLIEDGMTKNGGCTGKSSSYCDCHWAQSHDECIVSIPIPKETRAKAISIRLFPSFRNGGDPTNPRLLVGLSENPYGGGKINILVDEELAYNVETEEDDGTFTDWELKNTDKDRVVRITLAKKLAVGMASAVGSAGVGRVVLWWSRFFIGSTEIDVTKIEGRDMKKQREYANAWQKANDLFKDKVQQHNKIEIDP